MIDDVEQQVIPQKFKLMVTNHGTHPPELWGMETAEAIFIINPDGDQSNIIAAKRLQLSIAEVIASHHHDCMHREKSLLAANGQARCTIQPHDQATESLAEARHIMDAVLPLLQGTQWEAQYAKSEVQAAAMHIIATHLNTVKDIERQYHNKKGV